MRICLGVCECARIFACLHCAGGRVRGSACVFYSYICWDLMKNKPQSGHRCNSHFGKIEKEVENTDCERKIVRERL